MRRIAATGVALCVLALLAPGQARAENAEFFLNLSEAPYATLADGVRVTLALRGEPYAGVASQDACKKLVEAGVMKASWAAKADARLTRGKMAYMLVTTLGVKGGVTMRIFGPSPRYALRECVYLKLMAGGVANRYMSGAELVGVLMRADEFKAKRAQPAPAEQVEE